jgi:hypothetical protein
MTAFGLEACLNARFAVPPAPTIEIEESMLSWKP